MKMTKERALEILAEIGADATTDFDAIPFSVKAEIAEIARLERYRKPANGSGSLGRHFFAMVQRKAYAKTRLEYRVARKLPERGAIWEVLHQSPDALDAKRVLARLQRQKPNATLKYYKVRIPMESQA